MKIILTLCLLFTLVSCGIQSIPMAENELEASWAEVQNQYKRRSDLVPNLVEVVKGSAAHEKETLEGVINARAKATQVSLNVSELNEANMKRFQQVQGELSGALARLMAVSENYPQLKANENFRDLQVQLEGTENRITVARNRYIESVKGFNNQVTVPPTSWTNSLFFHKEKKAQFQVENIETIQNAPAVKF